jgi:hypothetical protein
MRLGGDRNDKGRIAAQQCCLRHVPTAADVERSCQVYLRLGAYA